MTRQAITSGAPLIGAHSARGTYSYTRWWMLSAVVPLLISFPISVYGGGHSGATVAPLYQIDLRSVVKGPFLFEPWGSPESRSGLPIRSLCFLDNQQIAVTVVTQAGGKPGLATRIEPNSSSPFRLYAILIGASSGRILASPDWPSNSRFAGIVAANDKGFVTESGRDLTLFSTDLTPGKRISLPSLPPTSTLLNVIGIRVLVGPVDVYFSLGRSSGSRGLGYGLTRRPCRCWTPGRRR